MAEYFANVIARLIVSYLTLLVMSLAILAGYWIIADYNSMIAFIHSVSDNVFAEFVVWMPFIFAWFKPDKRGNANSYYHRQANFWAMYDTTGRKIVVSKTKFFLLLIYLFGTAQSYAYNLGDTINCETSTTTFEYVKCKPENNIFEVKDILQDGWIAINSHSFYVIFKKVKKTQKVMRCLESNRFPNYLGACKSDNFDQPKTWLKEDAIKNGWKFSLAIGNTVYYVKE